MKKPSKDLAWHQSLATIFSREPCSESIDELLRSLEGLVDGVNSMAIIYAHGHSPQVTHHRLLANENPKIQINQYTEAAYLLDPFYCHFMDTQEDGVYCLNKVTPDGFKDSEYFNQYYRNAKLEDEICFLFSINDSLSGSISIGRSSTLDLQAFSPEELNALSDRLSIVKLIYSQWAERNTQDTPPTLVSHLDNALHNFGSSLLTPKECEILQLVLHGYSPKSIAEKLDNSQETIKHHRKKIYTKLDVSTQAELFHLFISSLRNMPTGRKNIDPLEIYLTE
jgi:DNA-binding CsgD family transcriptional regulator